MAYVSANLNLMAGGFAGGPRMWDYYAGADAQATVRVANYLSDGFKKGMRSGDWVMVRYASGAGSIHICNQSVAGAIGGSDTVDITDGLAVASTDTD